MNNKNRFYSSFFIVYILVFILPLLPLVKEVFPIIRFGENYTFLGFIKELLVVLFVFGSATYLFMARRSLVINWQVGLLLLFLLYGFSHLLVTTASFSNAVNNFRLLFLNVVLCISIIFLYLNKKVFLGNRLIFNLILYSAICVALFGLYEKFINPDVINLYQLTYSKVVKNLGIPGFARVRIASTLGNPINLGLFVVVGFISAVYIMETSNKKALSIFCFLCMLLFAFVSLFTLSRTAYGSFLIAIIIYIFFKILSVKKLQNKFLFLSLGLLFFTLIYIVINKIGGMVWLRLFQSVDVETLHADPRIEQWRPLLKDLLEWPFNFLWGFGLGNSGTSGLSGDFKYIENSFISIFYELGIIGLLLFCFILLCYLSNTINLFKRKNKEKQLLGFVLFAYLAVFVFASLFMDAYVNNPFGFYFWLFFALSNIAVTASNQAEIIKG